MNLIAARDKVGISGVQGGLRVRELGQGGRRSRRVEKEDRTVNEDKKRDAEIGRRIEVKGELQGYNV